MFMKFINSSYHWFLYQDKKIDCDPIACKVHMFVEFQFPLHPSHYANNLILVDQKLYVSLSPKVQLSVHYIEANPTHQIWDKTREPMLIDKHVWCNLVQIVENQLLDNDKQQECANMGILTKVFCYMCKTPFKGQHDMCEVSYYCFQQSAQF